MCCVGVRESWPSPDSLAEEKRFQSLFLFLLVSDAPLCGSHDAICLVFERERESARMAREDEKEAYQVLAVGAKMERDYGRFHPRRHSRHCEEKVCAKKRNWRGSFLLSKDPTVIPECLCREEVFLLCCTLTVYPLHTTVSRGGRLHFHDPPPPAVARYLKRSFYGEVNCLVCNLPFDNVCKAYFWNWTNNCGSTADSRWW